VVENTLLWLLGRHLHGSQRSHQRGQPAGSGQQLLGGFRHVLLLHIRHPLGGLDADGFPHGVKNMRLGDPTEIGSRGRRPMRGHVERNGFRQPVRCCHRTGLALGRQFYGVDCECRAMRKQRHAAVMIQLHDKLPQARHVARHLRRPTGMVIGPCLARFGVLDTIRMRSQHGADQTDVENVGVRAAIEDLRR
jgi:hypothetical protein